MPTSFLGRYGGAIGGVLGGLSGLFGARTQNAGQQNSGQVDITHSNVPYEGSMPYRQAGVDRAYELLYGPSSAPAPAPAATGGGGIRNTSAASGEHVNGQGGRTNRFGVWVPAGSHGGDGAAVGGGSTAPAPFAGESPETAAAIANASRVAAGMEHGAVTGAAQDYTAGTLRGEDQNAYRSQAADMLGPEGDFRHYLDSLFASDNGLSGSGGGSGGGSRGVTTRVDQNGVPIGPHASASASGPVGADATLRRILAGEDVPGAQAMRNRIKHQADTAFNEQVRQRNLQASASGMYGGTGQLADQEYALGQYGTGLADAYAQQDYGLYEQALGLGSAYDTAALDRAAQERISGNSLSASAGANAAALSSQERIARMGALGDAVRFGVSGMGSLGDSFSADQRAAASTAGDISGMGQAGYLNAGGMSLASDAGRNNFINSANQLRASSAATGVQRQQLAFDRERYAHQQPWGDVAAYQAIVSGAYDPFTSSVEQGTDRRAGQAPYVNPTSQALSGALAGYSIGSSF